MSPDAVPPEGSPDDERPDEGVAGPGPRPPEPGGRAGPLEGAVDGPLVDEYLRFLRGRGPRPGPGSVRPDARPGVDDLFQLLEAIVDTGEVTSPPLELDPVARRLGLVDPGGSTLAGGLVLPEGPDAIDVSLAELAHRVGAGLEVVPAEGRAGALDLRAECRTLVESVLVGTVGHDRFADLPAPLAAVFAERPATTAIAAVSTVSLLAVVLTEADCVRAIDPRGGWAEPAPPRPPEPFGLALGRHLERSLPRWDAVARLDEMLVLAPDDHDLAGTVAGARHAVLDRSARIPARRTARRQVQDLPVEALVRVVHDVRAGRLAGDDLVRRLRRLSEVGAS